MRYPQRMLLLVLSACLSYVTLVALYTQLGPSRSLTEKELEDARWIATSHSWLDRQACRWIGICGAVNWLRWKEPQYRQSESGSTLQLNPYNFSNAWVDPLADPTSWNEEERLLRRIPDFVFEYAPFVHLFDDEKYWPSDIAEHLERSFVRAKERVLIDYRLNLTDLESLNAFDGGDHVFLTGDNDPEDLPEWMLSRHNIPRESSNSASPGKQAAVGLRSNAPAVLIVVDRGLGIVDAFWFYFYSYNEGNTVFGIRFGNHVGDWEHSMVRFHNGLPKALYLSRHAWGSAYTYDAIEKIGKRPLIFSANGSHAHYPTAGPQPYILPFSLLKDTTSYGPLWDPTLNCHSYTYNPEASSFRASTRDPYASTGWLQFAGRWGDRSYDLGDKRQWRFFGETHYGSGPTGPRDKNLGRIGMGEKKGMRVRATIG